MSDNFECGYCGNTISYPGDCDCYDNLQTMTCDECSVRSVRLPSGATPSLVLCAECNGGQEAWNDVYDEGWDPDVIEAWEKSFEKQE